MWFFGIWALSDVKCKEREEVTVFTLRQRHLCIVELSSSMQTHPSRLAIPAVPIEVTVSQCKSSLSLCWRYWVPVRFDSSRKNNVLSFRPEDGPSVRSSLWQLTFSASTNLSAWGSDTRGSDPPGILGGIAQAPCLISKLFVGAVTQFRPSPL